jgi:AcrR family transcriptional regulator
MTMVIIPGMPRPARSRSPAPRRTRLSPEEVRERLYSEGLTAIRARGFEGVAVSDLTRAAGVAKGTFFNHFPTKEHLLSAFLEEIRAELEAEVREEGLVGTDAAVRLVEAFGRALEADPAMTRAVGPRLAWLPGAGESEGFLDALRGRFQGCLAESLPFAVPLASVPDSDLASLLAASVAVTVRDWALEPAESLPLVPTLTRRAVFLLRSAGFAAPDPPRG